MVGGGFRLSAGAEREVPFSDKGDLDQLTVGPLPTVGHHDTRDWNAEVDGWIRQLVEHRASYGSHASYGHEGTARAWHRRCGGRSRAGCRGRRRHGRAEVVDEVGDFFEGDEEEEYPPLIASTLL